MMNKYDRVIKHLEMIQGVINRLGHDSFLIKGWSMTILVAGIIFLARSEVQNECFALAFLIPVVGFWILDGYFIRQERLFRKLYDKIRIQKETDFAMNVMKCKKKSKCTRIASIFSETLIIFYIIEIVFVAAVFFILKRGVEL